MRYPGKRREVLEAARALAAWGLNRGSSGNVSMKFGDAIFITASGVAWDALSLDHIVDLRLDGSMRGTHQPTPSTEWRLHRDLYRARPELGAIVHTHAMFCTTLACLRMEIPAVHYMIAVAGTNRIRCAEYATFGTAELSHNAVRAMENAKACLLANHGMVAAGDDLTDALRVAREVELLAEQYWRALQIGQPTVLDDAEMERVRARFAGYGRAR